MKKWISFCILWTLNVTVGIALMAVLMGCSTPVVPDCPAVAKCPDVYSGMTLEEVKFLEKAKVTTLMLQDSEMGADRLEDALGAAEEKYLACEDNWHRYQLKSTR